MGMAKCRRCGAEWGIVIPKDPDNRSVMPGIPTDFGAEFISEQDRTFFRCKQCGVKHPCRSIGNNEFELLDPES